MSSQMIYEAEDPEGRTLQVAAEEDGSLSVSIFVVGQETTDWSMVFEDDEVVEFQICLAAYLHRKTYA